MEDKKQTNIQSAPIKTSLDIMTSLDFKVFKENREYSFHMPMGAPLGEAFDAVFTVLEKIRELQANAVAKAGEPVEEEKKDGEEE